MKIFIPIDRVYIRVSESYDDLNEILKRLDWPGLIRAVAEADPEGDGDPLYDTANDKVFEGRTKGYIVRKTNAFLVGLHERHCPDENMATFASKRQLNCLIRACRLPRKQISCYALVYLYVIYTLLEENSSVADDCALFTTIIYQLVRKYHENNPDDQLSAFLLGCFEPLIRAMQEKNPHLTNIVLPSRPRLRPKETIE